MGRHLITRVVIPVIFILTVGTSACGSQTVSAGPGEEGCVVKHGGGVKSRIRPENSGLPCSSIQSILVILSNGTGVSPLYNGNGEPIWVCRKYPKATLPREVRCHEGKLHFEMVRVQK